MDLQEFRKNYREVSKVRSCESGQSIFKFAYYACLYEAPSFINNIWIDMGYFISVFL